MPGSVGNRLLHMHMAPLGTVYFKLTEHANSLIFILGTKQNVIKLPKLLMVTQNNYKIPLQTNQI